MADDTDFIDYYEVLQVDPLSDDRTLETAYHYFAKLYHPDNSTTADVEKFSGVIESYRVLRNADSRAEYDREYDLRIGLPRNSASHGPANEFGMHTAADDAEIHEQIMLRLYRKRRASPLEPGIGGLQLQEAVGCSSAEMDFHLWYLKSKRMVEITEQGLMAITIEGVDYVLATSREDRRQKLLELRSGDREQEP